MYHKCSQVVLVLFGFRTEILEIEVTIRVHFDRDDFQASHSSGLYAEGQQWYTLDNISTYSWVSTVRTVRNQANITMPFTPRFVVSTNHAKTRIFTSSSRVWLERRRGKSSNFAKIIFQFLL